MNQFHNLKPISAEQTCLIFEFRIFFFKKYFSVSLKLNVNLPNLVQIQIAEAGYKKQKDVKITNFQKAYSFGNGFLSNKFEIVITRFIFSDGVSKCS